MSTITKRKGVSGLILVLIIALVLSSVVSFGFNDVNASSYDQVGKYTEAGNIDSDQTLKNKNSVVNSPTVEKTFADGIYAKYSKSIAGTDTDDKFKVTLDVETNEKNSKSTSYGASNVIIVIDVSSSMDSPTSKSRWTTFRDALLVFVEDFLAQNNNNQVSIAVFGGYSTDKKVKVHKNICDWTSDAKTAKDSFNMPTVKALRTSSIGDNYAQTNGQAAFRAGLEGIQSSTMKKQNTAIMVVTDGQFVTSYDGGTSNGDAIKESDKITAEAERVKNQYAVSLYTFGIDVASDPINPAKNPNVKKSFLANTSTIESMLKEFYIEIITETKSFVNALTVTDPMSKWVKYGGIDSGNENSTQFAGNTLTWDLSKDSTCVKTDTTNTSGEVTGNTKKYSLTYTITLDKDIVDTEDVWETYLPTNKDTVLKYNYDNGSGTATPGQVSFLIPTVTAGKAPIKVGDIKIAKTVSSNAPAGDTFDFIVYVGDDTSGPRYTGTYSVGGVDKGNMSNGQLKLSGGQTATLTDIPLGTKITTTEVPKSYYKVQGSDTKSGEVSLATQTIAFKNNYEKSKDLNAVKTSNPANGSTVKNGDTIRYTIAVKNDDVTTATGVVVKDNIPEHTSYVSVENGGVYDSTSDSVSWYLGDMSPKQEKKVSFTVNVSEETDDNIVNEGLFKQTGETTSKAALANTDPFEKTAEVIHYPPSPQMEIVKSNTPGASTEILAGDTIEYKIKVNNTGDRTLKNVWLRDYIPASTTYKSGSVSAGGTYDTTKNYVQWVIPQIAIGDSAEVTFAVTLDDDYPTGIQIKNSALGEILGEGGTPRETDPSDTSNEVINKTPTEGDINISKAVSSNAPSTDTFDFIVYEGGDTTGSKYSGSYSIDGVPKGNMSNGQLTLKGGEMATLTGVPLDTFVTVEEQFKPFYKVEGSAIKTGEVKLSTNTIAFKNNYEKSDKLVAKKTSNPTDGAIVKNGDDIKYTITVTNNDVTTAMGVVVKDNIPTYTTFSSVENGGIYNGSDSISWYVGDLSPGESAKVSFTVKVIEETNNNIENIGLFKQTGEASEDTALSNSDPFEETSKVVHEPPEPKMALVKTSSIDNTKGVSAGDVITYKIKVNNTGDRTLKNVWVKDYIPANTAYTANTVSTSYGGVYITTSNAVQWVIPEIAIGDSAEVSFSVTVNSGYVEGTIIKNTALGEILGEHGEPGDKDPANKSNEVTNPTATVLGETSSEEAPEEEVLGEEAKTGDSMDSIPYLFLMLITAAGALIIASRRSTKKD